MECKGAYFFDEVINDFFLHFSINEALHIIVYFRKFGLNYYVKILLILQPKIYHPFINYGQNNSNNMEKYHSFPQHYNAL